MGKMVQIRNVPEDVHRTLKVRAAREGVSLSAYLLRELERLARQPTFDELVERIRSAGPVRLSETSAQAVRAVRAERTAR